MRPYHPANLKHQPYAPWRVIVLAWTAKLLGVQVKIQGIPFGGHRLSRRRQLLWDIRNRPVVNHISGSRIGG